MKAVTVSTTVPTARDEVCAFLDLRADHAAITDDMLVGSCRAR